MKVLVSVDMEGLAGVVSFEEVLGAQAFAQEELERELLWLLDELFASGAAHVAVADGHHHMRTLTPRDLPPNVELIRGAPRPLSMVGAGATYDAAFFLGYHARAGTAGVLAHTYTRLVREVRLNHLPVGEATLNALVLGAFGTPVVFVSGDDVLQGEVAAALPWAETVVVKEALGSRSARTPSLPEVERRLRAGVRRALDRRPEWRPLVLPPPYRLEVAYQTVPMAEFAGLLPGAERLAPDQVGYASEDVLEVFRAFRAMNALAEGA